MIKMSFFLKDTGVTESTVKSLLLQWPLFSDVTFELSTGSLVAQCLTRNPGVLGSSHAGSFDFFPGSVLGQDTSEPSLVLEKPRKYMNNVSCCRDMTEILSLSISLSPLTDDDTSHQYALTSQDPDNFRSLSVNTVLEVRLCPSYRALPLIKLWNLDINMVNSL